MTMHDFINSSHAMTWDEFRALEKRWEQGESKGKLCIEMSDGYPPSGYPPSGYPLNRGDWFDVSDLVRDVRTGRRYVRRQCIYTGVEYPSHAATWLFVPPETAAQWEEYCASLPLEA